MIKRMTAIVEHETKNRWKAMVEVEDSIGVSIAERPGRSYVAAVRCACNDFEMALYGDPVEKDIWVNTLINTVAAGGQSERIAVTRSDVFPNEREITEAHTKPIPSEKFVGPAEFSKKRMLDLANASAKHTFAILEHLSGRKDMSGVQNQINDRALTKAVETIEAIADLLNAENVRN